MSGSRLPPVVGGHSLLQHLQPQTSIHTFLDLILQTSGLAFCRTNLVYHYVIPTGNYFVLIAVSGMELDITTHKRLAALATRYAALVTRRVEGGLVG